MKYDGVESVGAGGEGNSHTLVLELVGTGKRVLDVGCSTGYLAQDLVQCGNKVSGVEIDVEAAEKARPLLEHLVVGDLDRMDLADELPAKAFDVVVFADVLEHLKDPVRTLAQAKALLDDGGYAVLSIPNVAHASVRLSLLQGRFDYRPVGLLDETHLRFFTRSSLEELLDQAGFVATDVRRTTLPPFATEIPLEPGDFPPDLVDLVEDDPDSSTYQFVLTAVPAPGVARSVREEMARLHEQVSVVARALRNVPPLPTVGVAAPGGGLDAVRQAVVVAELRRRLDGFSLRSYHAGASAGAAELSGEPLFPLSLGEGIAAEVDAMVLAAPSFAGTSSGELASGELASGLTSGLASELASGLASGLAEEGVEVSDISSWPADPVGLAGRLLSRAVLDRRRRYLDLTGHHGGGSAPTIVTNLDQPAEGSPLAGLARRRAARVVTVQPGEGPLDLAAVVAGADVVVTDDAALASLACGLDRPIIVVADRPGAFSRWARGAGLAVGTLEELPALGEDLSRRPASEARDDLWGILDTAFDDLAARLLSAGTRRTAAAAPARIAELARRVQVLEAANAGLRGRLELLLGQLEIPPVPAAGPAGAAGAASRAVSKRTEESLGQAQAQVQHLQEEIDRIYSTRLMKTVQPVRRVYGRLRALRG